MIIYALCEITTLEGTPVSEFEAQVKFDLVFPGAGDVEQHEEPDCWMCPIPIADVECADLDSITFRKLGVQVTAYGPFDLGIGE